MMNDGCRGNPREGARKEHAELLLPAAAGRCLPCETPVCLPQAALFTVNYN
jgi:hypothetical protein